MYQRVRHYLGLIRFSHTVFALPFALLSAALAWKDEAIRAVDLVAILLCMVFARSAAMSFNRIADRHFDARNPRTANRHLPSGILGVWEVWVFTVVSAAAFLASTSLFLLRDPSNPWPAILGVPVLLFVGGYSFAKRFTSLAHYWLGVSLMFAPLATWIAIRGLVSLQTPAVLGLAVMFWVSGFDILYSCQDADFDRAAGLHSIPARFGVRAALRIALVSHLAMLFSLVSLYFVSLHLGAIYLTGLCGIAALVLYQHSLVRPTDLTRVNRAFFHVNAIVSIGLLLLVLIQLAVGD